MTAALVNAKIEQGAELIKALSEQVAAARVETTRARRDITVQMRYTSRLRNVVETKCPGLSEPVTDGPQS